MSTDEPRYGRVDRDYAIKLATMPPDDDGPVWMVNLMKYREIAAYEDGREATITGQEADDLYSPTESLRAVGAEVVFFGDVDQHLLGDGVEWDRVAVVKYPTRRSFIEMQSRPDFQEKHPHKEAGMEQTFVIGCQPMMSPDPPADVELPDWADVPHPPTADDGPAMVLHVIRYHDTEAADRTPPHMEAYQSAAAEVALRHGVRISAWFAAEGTIVGDGRQWHQVRCNLFPSKAAFMAVVADPDRLAAQHDHREVAIADTYAMVVRPTINQLAESLV
ncbi:MAG: hypothetical protein QNJ12_09345 [Ilumatobacter sp.]|uniref:hypothetical protein n=1 Tax=Ilumatobacter sp. TaxID=1967498 RepID=UPI0026287B4E|nr:hypothetical protein [Ilumatobacter sp.]MDJ0768988.1 hypothetical protein [Ilumatobacter sp.]